MYPIVYIDGLRIKVQDKGAVTIKVALPGRGRGRGRPQARRWAWWIAEVAEGAKFWHSVAHPAAQPWACATSLSLCCDGLTGLPEALTSAIYPDTIVQTCVM